MMVNVQTCAAFGYAAVELVMQSKEEHMQVPILFHKEMERHILA